MRRAVCTILLLLFSAPLWADTYTLAPAAYQTVLDSTGNPVSGACIWTYLAGSSTPAATYSDTNGTANGNPIQADSAGRFTAYLVTGNSYKFVVEAACTPPAHGSTIRTQDNISAVPQSANNIDLTGTAGETITAGQAVYLSDGSGGKNAGQWYKADTGNAYSSSLPEIGIAVANIASGSTGPIRIHGLMTGLTSLAIGSTYYVGTAGALSLSAGANSRVLGVAMTTTALVLTPNPASTSVLAWANDFRLTLQTGTPVPIADVTAATTLYLTPYSGNRIDLPDANGNPIRVTSGEISITLPGTGSYNYDVFVFLNGNVPALETVQWTNDTTRTTNIVRTNGRFFKSGDLTRLYVGTCRTTIAGQSEDSFAKRYVFNQYNRIRRLSRAVDSTASWTYTTNTWRQMNGNAADQLDVVIGVAEVSLHAEAIGICFNAAGPTIYVGIGQDSNSTTVAGSVGMGGTGFAAGQLFQIRAVIDLYPAVGRHFYAALERSQGVGTTTWYGNNGDSTLTQAGIYGWVEM